jgi:hypothetical protein
VILGVAVPTQGLPTFSLEVDRSGVEEHQIQTAEQIAAVSVSIPVENSPKLRSRIPQPRASGG